MTRVLLVDAEGLRREGVAELVRQLPGIEAVVEADSVAAALPLLDGVQVALVRALLPDGTGSGLVQRLSRVNPKAKALVLAGVGDRHAVAQAFAAGAVGVLAPTSGRAALAQALATVLAGGAITPPHEVVAWLRLAAREREADRAARERLADLTRRERQVLRALVQGWRDQEIAEHLGITHQTVRTHMVNLLGKLGVTTRLQGAVFALRYGADVLDEGTGALPIPANGRVTVPRLADLRRLDPPARSQRQAQPVGR